MIATHHQPAAHPAITPDTLLPELLARQPAARAVLDRYGLRGCGGAGGPHESVGFFARVHGVDEAQLLRELHEVQAAPQPAGPAAAPALPELQDTIYRRYFSAGILAILTAGATWGAYLLWKIGFTGSFTGVSIHEVNAHGHAQIYGWVGLFIMGFALQAFPRLWHTRLVAPPLAVVAFAAMLVGIIVRTIGMTAAGATWSIPAAMTGGALEIAAVAVFATQILLTFRRSGARLEPYSAFVVAGLGWFLLQALMCVWHTWTTMTAPSREELLWYVATYQAPLRDLQIHGLALFMILGVSLRMLPALFGVPATSARRAWWGLVLLMVAVVGEVALFVAYRWTGNHALAALLMLPWIMLAVGIALVAMPWKLWRPLPQNDHRSGKFVRAAYAWLAISMVMLLLLPVYQVASGIDFSHAYYGAIRHAITVGFISLMIMGFAAKVVPTLNGVDVRKLSALWGPFILVNVGCFLRVSTQTLTDWDSRFFAVVGVSGMLEVTGLAWWGIGLIRIMRQGKREQLAVASCAGGPRGKAKPDIIAGGHIVADVLAWFPQTEEVFVHHGLGAIRNPVLRATVARTVSLADVAAMHHIPLEVLLAELNIVKGDIAGDAPHPASGAGPCGHSCATCPSSTLAV